MTDFDPHAERAYCVHNVSETQECDDCGAFGFVAPSPDAPDPLDSFLREARDYRAAGRVAPSPTEERAVKRAPCAHGDPCRENRCVEYGRWVAPSPDAPGLRDAAQRLVDASANKAAVDGLYASGHVGWKEQMDADDAFLCALQDTRTALDGRERPHRHAALAREETPDA